MADSLQGVRIDQQQSSFLRKSAYHISQWVVCQALEFSAALWDYVLSTYDLKGKTLNPYKLLFPYV